MKKKVIAVFDIGKTNKKFFLFDQKYREVYREYAHFDEITDEDDHPTEDLTALETWSKEVFHRMLDAREFDITALNFSSYGASLVHLNDKGSVLTPLYNYTKPLPKDIFKDFYGSYGLEKELSRITGSPKLGMLNTGMQLYWIKKSKPDIFQKIKYSLHLPQYLSYLFTGVAVSEYTSIGCHTLLWDYERKDYHSWVYKEGIAQKLPSITSSKKTIPVSFGYRTVEVGPGIHDSSAALIPYVRSISKPFSLVSTGTWSIAINPFNDQMLTKTEIEQECLFNMRINGSPVKVSRLFLGNEYKLQIAVLAHHFKVSKAYHRNVKFDLDIFMQIQNNFAPMFRWFSIPLEGMPAETKIAYDSFEHAYHQLLYELVLLQEQRIRAAIGSTSIERIYIDGGFSGNDVYLQLLAHRMAPMKIRTTDASLGSALGAALVISDTALKPKFLKKEYALKKHIPFQLK